MYVYGSDNKLYRLPYSKNRRYYDLRQIKKQKGNRYYLNEEKEWLSERSIKNRNLLIREKDKKILIKSDNMPF